MQEEMVSYAQVSFENEGLNTIKHDSLLQNFSEPLIRKYFKQHTEFSLKLLGAVDLYIFINIFESVS